MGLHQDAGIGNNHSGLQLVLGLPLSTGSPQELTAATTTNTPSVPSNNKVDDHHILTLSFITSSNHDADQPSLTLGLCGGDEALELSSAAQTSTNSPHSAVSSLWSGRVVVKRERDLSSSDDQELEEARQVISCSRGSGSGNEDEDGPSGASRKKLRLTKDQSALLEDSFKHHSTLNPKQKQALARQLNLRPRQVEVWFQNRRARTKLKQKEVDCELLKKCCETLTDENRRLKKELQELKAMKLPHPLYMPMPAATLTMCPACEHLGGSGTGGSGGGTFNKIGPFSSAPKPHFYNPFTNPSAAC